MAASSSRGVFQHLRERSRSSFVGQHRLDIIVHSRLEHGPKYVPLYTLKSIFGVAGLTLAEAETEYIVKRFADNRRRVEWRKLMVALDVAAPVDFVDPDRSFLDNLPQPYRLIVGVLDTEIIDRAWALIVDRHPELDTSPADEARAAADIDLKRSAHHVFDSGVRTHHCCGVAVVLMFTAGHDGSICLRVVGALENVVSQIDCRGIPADRKQDCGAPAAVTFLSRPVGAFRDQCGRRSSVRIAAVTALAGEERVTAEGNGDGQGNTVASSILSVLEATLPEQVSRTTSDQLHSGGTDGGIEDLTLPTLRVICVVELSSTEAAVECAVSPDGRRLAASLANGRVAIWVLPPFSPPPKRGSPSAHRGGWSTAADAKDAVERQTVGDSDADASRGGSSTSFAGEDASAALATDAEANAAAADATAAARPVRLTQPEFSIPHLPSPEELAYAKTLREYNKRVGAGEPQDPASNPGVGEEGEEDTTPPSSPPQLPGIAHHLASVDFLPSTPIEGAGGNGGGLSVWRANANVWRFYRLPPLLHEEGSGATGEQMEKGAQENRAVEAPASGADPGGEDVDGTGGQAVAILPAKFDISSLPWSEWILPSPITALAVCEEEDGARGGGGAEKDGRGAHGAASGPGLDWNCCGDGPQADRLAPLVAIGTENGGVYLSDAVLGTTREALSRHRARVTTLAFHRKGFLVSGSVDEMLQFHHISVDRVSGGGRGCCPGGTPRLRCLHDARGSGIVRVACLEEVPLAFAEDTSGRVVAYDLLTGSMLGVLALGSDSIGGTTAAKSEIGSSGGRTSAEVDGAVVPRTGVLWSEGGGHLAAVLSNEEDASAVSPVLHHGSSEVVGVWSAADVMWGLSPGLRATVGEERPRDLAGIFFSLDPAQRKGTEGKPGQDHLVLSSPSPPAAEYFHKTPAPPTAGAIETVTVQGRHRSPTAGEDRSNRIFSGGSGQVSPSRTAISNAGSTTKRQTSHSDHPRHPTALTEGNIGRLLGPSAWGAGTRWKRETSAGTGAVGGGVPWRNEVGAAERVKRYMDGRHGARAMRQARLDNVTRNLLHAL